MLLWQHMPWATALLGPLSESGGQGLGTIAIAAIVLFALISLSRRRSAARDLDSIPSPGPGLPLLGNLLDVGHNKSHQTVAEWAALGPVVKFKMLNLNNVLISDPALITPLLARGTEELPKAIDFVYKPLDPIYSPKSISGFFTTKDDAAWAALRKGCAPAFSPDNVRKAFPKIRDIVGTVSDNLATQAKTQGPDGIDMNEATLRVALDVIGLIGFGRDFQARTFGHCQVLEVLPEVLAEFSKRVLNPLRAVQHTLMPWLPEAMSYRSKLQTMHQLWASLAKDIRATDVEAAESQGDTSLRVCIAKVKDPATGKPLTEEQLAPNAATFLVGGFETTAHSAAWALYEVARLPEVQSKVAAELAGAGLLWAPGRPGRELQFSDLAALPYLDQVWREALRLHPVGSIAPIRLADRDVMLQNGLRIPKGTICWLSITSLHQSPFNFVEPLRFWPERWQQGAAAAGSGNNGKGAAPSAGGEPTRSEVAMAGVPTPSGNSACPARSFLPYSMGPRDCIGQALANMEGKAMLAMLCSRFEFEVAPRMGTQEDVRAAEINRLTMQPGEGIWLQLKPRGL